MDFYNMIKNLEDDQIKELVSFKIDEARYHSYQNKKRFIGIDCDINPSLTFTGEQPLDSQAMWNGFISEDVKVIYSFLPNEDGFTVNNGCYYYIDDNEYLYEFALYIKKQNIKDEIEFLTHVYKFIDNYFNSLNTDETHRKIMHSPLLNTDGKYINPSNKHRLIDFKNKNNAECSEYSAMAQNILTIFEYPSIYFGGSVKSKHGSGGHAFNFTLIKGMACIIDFTIPVEIYNVDGTFLNYTPFIGPIKDFDSDTLKQHLLDYIPYDFKDYYYLKMHNELLMISNGSQRHYIVGNVEYYNEKKKVK